MTPEQRAALVAWIHNIEQNDGLHVDYVPDGQVIDLIEAINSLDGGNRDPMDYVPEP